MRMMKLFSVINFISFQLCWFTAATYKQEGLLIIGAILTFHFLLSPKKIADIKVLSIALVGIFVDQILIISQIIQLPQSSEQWSFIPLWLIFLWCSFAWCFNHSLHWLLKLALPKVAVLGGVFGALSYYAALRLEVFSSLVSPIYFALVMLLVWSILLPIFVRMHSYVIKENAIEKHV